MGQIYGKLNNFLSWLQKEEEKLSEISDNKNSLIYKIGLIITLFEKNTKDKVNMKNEKQKQYNNQGKQKQNQTATTATT